jgi:dihydroorotate dehydrogenase
MTFLETIAKFDRVVRLLSFYFSPRLAIELYSRGRREFVNALSKEQLSTPRYINSGNSVTIWGVEFGNRLMNAAGMFKNGIGYDISYMQGAGAFLAGTTTATPRAGNRKNGILHPFMPYPRSEAAMNWMGLPNDSHETVAERISRIHKKDGCPIGVSLSESPGVDFDIAMAGIVNGFMLYEKAGVTFAELNESCPNTEEHNGSTNLLDKALISRLEYISDKYIKNSSKSIPIVVKFSTDTELAQIPALVNSLIDMGFGGVNFGNTSVNYMDKLIQIDHKEEDNFRYFMTHFGGGISGKPLREDSLKLASEAVKIRNSRDMHKEFIVIRTGGIETIDDYNASVEAGVDLMQWFTGYFELFSKYGHDLYKHLFTQK